MRWTAFAAAFVFCVTVSGPANAFASQSSTTKPKPTATPVQSRSRCAAGSRWIGEPISLDLKDADLLDVLHTFSKLAGLNMVIDPDVKGSVTVRLDDVPWDQALDLIVRMNGYGYMLEGNVLRVGLPSKL